jgi:NADH dehydrogenase
MSQLATIYGGSGFVGRYIARRLAKQGWRVRVAVRRPNEAMFVKPYGVVGQVEPVFCNIRDDASVAAVAEGADAVVNCVGTFDARGANNFAAVQAEGAERIARVASQMGIKRMVHISAIGADAKGLSTYAQTKAAGEEGVLRHIPDAMILRPSVIFGPEDQFFNRFAGMAPVVPVVGGATRFQPVYVDDVAQAAELGVTQGIGGIYELGGPDVASFRELMHEMLQVIQRSRLVLSLPIWAGGLMALGADVANRVTFGLAPMPITPDQVKSLGTDNIVSEGAKTLADLGITPTSMEAVMPEYLWRFRPSGQYAAIKASAKNLKS